MMKKTVEIGVCVLLAAWSARMKFVVLLLAGCSLGAVAYGSSMVYEPLGYIVPGLLLWYDLKWRR